MLIGEGSLEALGEVVASRGGTGVIVIDENVARLWGPAVVGALSAPESSPRLLEIPAGEESKSLAQLERVLGFLEEAAVARDGWLAAVGGGVVGDLAGFAAASWLRGISCYHFPTTLLAMVDSALGGKTGINSRLTKNAIGAFWQPAGVACDPRFLKTLPALEFQSAFAEILKYGIALDAELFAILVREREVLLGGDWDKLRPVVRRCAELKLEIVSEDERDHSRRALLNYGHTVGHALEEVSGYRVRHGFAVAAGMIAAARVSAVLGLCSTAVAEQVVEAIHAFGLRVRLPRLDPEEVLAVTARDKKRSAGAVRWVLLRGVGRAEMGHEVRAEIALDAIGEVLE